ncbi:MAG: helix-turn-helix domain-containing protein [Oscillibacter sp.]|nr:helix-turn-helix domain-containing protein [Oscillibacter sp.]
MNDIFKYEKRKEEIGKRIKTLRKQKHLSQDDLANRLFYIAPTKDKALGQSTISSWERGVTLPPLERMIALASIFDCDVAYLLGDYSKEKKDNSDICDMTGLSQKSLSQLLRYKEQYPDYIDSLNFLLESDNFEDVLYYIYECDNALRYVGMLRAVRQKRLKSIDNVRDYTPDLNLLNTINNGQEKANSCKLNLSTQFGFIVQELERKVESEFNTPKEGYNG